MYIRCPLNLKTHSKQKYFAFTEITPAAQIRILMAVFSFSKYIAESPLPPFSYGLKLWRKLLRQFRFKPIVSSWNGILLLHSFYPALSGSGVMYIVRKWLKLYNIKYICIQIKLNSACYISIQTSGRLAINNKYWEYQRYLSWQCLDSNKYNK